MTIQRKLNDTYLQHVIVTKLNECIAACHSLVLRVNSLDVMNSTVQIHHATMMAGRGVKHAWYAIEMEIVTLCSRCWTVLLEECREVGGGSM